MKQQIFTLLLSLFLGTVLMAQIPAGVVKKATTAPVVDGIVDEVWATANSYNIEVQTLSNTADATLGSSGETTWKALWTDEGMYILLQVNDDVFFPCYSGCYSWEYDKPEIYIDVNPELADGVGPSVGGNGHYQFAQAFVETQLNGEVVTGPDGVVNAFLVADPSYVGEYFIPFSKLLDKTGVEVIKNATIGFDVTILDKDAADVAFNRAVWVNDGAAGASESWTNMDNCGTITLEGAGESIVATELTVSSTGGLTTIETEAGTLQMIANILPVNATTQTVIWSVENGTGRATISSTGLLTAVMDGKVTALAKTKDGSAIEAYKDITISNQFITMSDVDVIKNGNFDTDGGLPEFWQFYTGNGGAGPVVTDGVVICAPNSSGYIWDYQFNQAPLNALPDIEYIFSFKAWSDADREFKVDFEDKANGNTRYGTDLGTSGAAEWTFGITTVPAWYRFNVMFEGTKMFPNTNQTLLFQLSSAADVVYLDSISLVSVTDLLLIDDPAIGVQKNSFKTINVYPNPVTNQLNINLVSVNSRITIFNSLGRKMEEVIVPGTKATLDVSSYASGLYFVKVNNDTLVKFVK